MRFLEAIRNMFRIPDLRKRLLFTLGLLAVLVLAFFRIPSRSFSGSARTLAVPT